MARDVGAFLDFMNRVAAAYPEREIRPRQSLPPQAKPRLCGSSATTNVDLHSTPTHTSRLSQIEIGFSIPTPQ
jgi:hypothetical protein